VVVISREQGEESVAMVKDIRQKDMMKTKKLNTKKAEIAIAVLPQPIQMLASESPLSLIFFLQTK
jgi:hypothetical protein